LGSIIKESRSAFVNLFEPIRVILTYKKSFPKKKIVPAPFSIALANANRSKLGGSNQKLILLSLGNQFYVSNFLPTWTMSSSYFSSFF